MKSLKRHIFLMMVLPALILAFGLSAYANVSKAEAESIARKLIPASCKMIESEDESHDMEWEFDFLTKNGKTRYEITISENDGKVIEIEMTKVHDHGGKTVKISASKAKDAVLKKFKDASIIDVDKETHTGTYGKRYYYEVEFKTGTFHGEAEVNAQTGKIIKWTKEF